MTVLKAMLKLALFPLLLLLILALASWIMKLADGGEVLKMLITAFVVFALPYIAMSIIAKISFFADELRDFLQS